MATEGERDHQIKSKLKVKHDERENCVERERQRSQRKRTGE
jgi:hypothetical protein